MLSTFLYFTKLNRCGLVPLLCSNRCSCQGSRMYLEYSISNRFQFGSLWIVILYCFFFYIYIYIYIISWYGNQESDILHTGHLGFNEVVTNSFKIFDILKGLKKIFKNRTI